MSLSPAARRVCVAALDLLADRGYDGSSLGEIARMAGMRKASLYSHFAGKDDLVSAALEMSLSAEREFVATCFADDRGDLPGGVYLERVTERYRAAASLRFLLRTAYAPPLAIRELIINHYRAFLAEIDSLFRARLRATLSEAEQDHLAQSYLGVVDSIQVELLYGEADSVERRRAALWRLLTESAASSAEAARGDRA